MSLPILADPHLEVTLSRIDQDLAEQTRSGGCRHCRGRLHSARYRRKPRALRGLDPRVCHRQSYCCSRQHCRRRTTPPSVLFLGRRVYLAVVVVLVTAMTQGISGRRLRGLRTQLGVDRRTLERWRRWWVETFPATRWWKARRARLHPPIDEGLLPRSLVSRFDAEEDFDGIVSVLRFLSPIACRCACSSRASRGGPPTRRGCSSCPEAGVS